MKGSNEASLQSPISIEKWEQSGQYFRFNEYKIFYRTSAVYCSTKPVLLLMHGFPTSSFDYTYLWPELDKQFNLITLDMLGFGFSDKPLQHQYSTAEQADIVESVLMKEHIKELHILAHDYGDTVVQEMIARQMQDARAIALNIRSVCFMNGGLFPETHCHTRLQGLLAGRWGWLARFLVNQKRASNALWGLFGKQNKPSQGQLDIMWRLFAKNHGTRISHKLLQYIQERKHYRSRWVGALQYTHIPLRLINGPEDPVSGINMVENYRQSISSPDVVLLEGAGHFPHIEMPSRVLAAYLEFYNRVSRKG